MPNNINIPPYSKDVFFYPWVGDNYANGWSLVNNSVTYQGNNGAFCVMVVGEEDYCKGSKYVQDRNIEEEITFTSTGYASKNARQCFMHRGTNDCAHLIICKRKTIRMVHSHIEQKFNSKRQKQHGLWPYRAPSLANFEQIFQGHPLSKGAEGDERQAIWNHLIFSEFFQCGMPSPKDNKNKNMRNAVASRSYDALCNIITIHKPHIVFILGNNAKQVIKSKIPANNLLSINGCNTLFVFVPHPAPINANTNKKTPLQPSHIIATFQHAQYLRGQGIL